MAENYMQRIEFQFSHELPPPKVTGTGYLILLGECAFSECCTSFKDGQQRFRLEPRKAEEKKERQRGEEEEEEVKEKIKEKVEIQGQKIALKVQKCPELKQLIARRICLYSS